MKFTIPGKPFAKQRPRFSRKSGRSYTPKETVSFERTVAQYAMAEAASILEGPVKLTVLAVFEPAKSWSKKRRAAALSNPHTQRPDLDNCVKAVLDGLNRVAFADDSQVAVIECQKVWGETAGTHISVEAIG